MSESNIATNELLFHTPVLINEVIEYLDPQPGKVYLDVTFGSGGHSRALLEHEPNCTVIALDWDIVSLEAYAPVLKQEFGSRFRVIWGNFALLYRLLKKEGIKSVDGILADFGTSMMQIKQRPGFSVYSDTPLDMRMSPPHQRVTAQQIIATATEEKLRELFWQLGEEKQGKKIAYAIVQERKKKPIKTTGELIKIIDSVIPSRPDRKKHPATKIFQALRMHVNNELENMSSFLTEAIRVLNPGGRLVCISFHSLEDRMVKQFFKEQELQANGTIITKKVVIPTQEEIEINRASRSAKLRAFSVIK